MSEEKETYNTNIANNDYDEQWISASERLPEHQLPVIIYCPEINPYVMLGYYIDDVWVISYRGISVRVSPSHWQEMPQPPKINPIEYVAA